jgi:TPR repeat protein
MARLEEKLEEIGRQISPAKRERPAPRPTARHPQFGTADPIADLREAHSKNGEPAPAPAQRRGPPRALLLAIFVTLASLAGALLLHGARGKASAGVDQTALLMRKAQSGDANAQSQLAFAYLRGEGVKHDDGAAVQWSRKAAAKGQPDAEYLLGSLIQSGTGTSRDAVQAFMWFQRSADAGNVKAMHNLAIAYIQGNGTPKDATMAATWFARAAAAGYVDSAFDLAVLYEQGLGVRQDEQQALHWYRAAANAGDRTAAARAHLLETAGHP